MKRSTMFRFIITLAGILTAIVFMFLNFMNISSLILLGIMAILPISMIKILLDESKLNLEMLKERLHFQILWSLVLLSLGVNLSIKTGLDDSVGFGIIVGSIVILIMSIIRYRRQQKSLTSGEILWDERDYILAGKAAIFTIKISTLLLALVFFAYNCLKPDIFNSSLYYILAVIICFISLTYKLVFNWLRKMGA